MLALLLAVALAPAAHAAPVELRHIPDATAIALAGPDVIALRQVHPTGVRVVAIPRAGGRGRTLLSVPETGWGYGTDVLAASPERVAAIVVTERQDKERTVFAGPPSGPLVPLVATPTTETAWIPVSVDVDGDRVLIVESKRDGSAARARIHTPAGGFADVAWPSGRVPVRLAGAFALTAGPGLELADLATGTPLAPLGGKPDEDATEDIAADGRVVVPTRAGLLTAAPGAPARPLPGSRGLFAPRFFGPNIAALDRRSGRLTLLAPDGARTTLGPPSTAQTDMDADDQGVAWLFNGCLRASSGPPARAVCLGSEIALRERARSKLNGRTVLAPVRCVHARARRCRGTVLALNASADVVGRARFSVPRGTERRVAIRLSERAATRLRKVELFALVTDGAIGAGAGDAELKLIRG